MADDPSRRQCRRGRWRTLAAVNAGYAAALVVLALAPDVPTPIGAEIPDWLAHAGAYGVQTVLLSSLMVHRMTVGPAALGGAVTASAFGLATECLQLLQPARTVEGSDVIANAVGATIAGLVIVLSRRLISRGRERP